MSSFPLFTALYTLLGSYLVLYIVPKLKPNFKLNHIPTAGCTSDSWFASWAGGFKFIKQGNQMVIAGHQQFPGRVFKVPTPFNWIVVAGSQHFAEEMKMAKDEVLSFSAGVEDILQAKYTVGNDIVSDSWLINVIRTPLTRNLNTCYDTLREEIITSFREELPVPDDGNWHKIIVFQGILRIVSRTSNRMFIGLPLCRNPDFIKLTTQFAEDVIQTGLIISLFPHFLRPIAGKMLGPLPRTLKKARKLLGPLVQYRIDQHIKFGQDWDARPNDVLSWLIDAAEPGSITVENLIQRILTINFGAIHTTSSYLANALYDLAARPEYLQPLREEIESVVSEGGWNKAALGKMRKLDSFVRESGRLTGAGAVTVARKALQDFTFSDGTFIPTGTFIGVSGTATQTNEKYYPNPDEFDGYRFYNLRREPGQSTKHQSISLNPTYLVFGHGRHACPGRFLAMVEVKNLLAHMIVNYDLKFENNQRPPTEWLLQIPNPSSTAVVMLKKRASS